MTNTDFGTKSCSGGQNIKDEFPDGSRVFGIDLIKSILILLKILLNMLIRSY